MSVPNLDADRMLGELLASAPDIDNRRAYITYHRRRFTVLFDWVHREVERRRADAPVRVLDIGASYQTAVFRELLTGALVDTLGFEDTTFPPRAGERHVERDLNTADNPARWAADERRYGVIVLAEVIEHLYTAPRQVLSRLAALLAPGGCIVIQTPNAVSLQHRITMVRGRHPYEMIREDRKNPGHFREYTAPELKALCEQTGLTVSDLEIENYFGVRTSRKARLYDRVCAALPDSFSDGITLVAHH